ncbi:MAG: hypothetical protein P8J87_07140 [Verrucomicrobiales bacterium]|nr:hypothetical protein [Verrucomicrobiales bacterium]
MNISTLTTILAAMVASGIASAAPQPEFSLPENNNNTDRAGLDVSPRDYRQFISVYYFGHET